MNQAGVKLALEALGGLPATTPAEVDAVKNAFAKVIYDAAFYAAAPPGAHASTHAAAGTDPIGGPLHLNAGTAAALTAPLKFTSGTLLAAPEVGAIEFLSDTWYATITTGAARKLFVLSDAALSAGLIPYITANSRLATSTSLAYNSVTGTLAVDAVTINNTPLIAQTGAPGKLLWNDIAGTLEFQLGGGNVTLQVGQEQVLKVRNGEVTPLAEGEVVYINGSSGVHNIALRASNATEAASDRTIGVVTEVIGASPGEGYITVMGMVRNVNTNHLTEGALVYLGVAGATTATPPVAPAHLVIIGACVKKSGGAGVIYVHVTAFPELSELHDVKLTGLATGDSLVYDSVLGYWKNIAASAAAWLLRAGDNMTGPLGLAASVAGAPGTAALKLPSGPLLLAPEAGAIERLTDKYYGTISTGTARKQFLLTDADLTAGRVLYTSPGGRALDSSTFTRDATTGQIGITTTANTGLLVTDTTGLGELAMKARCSAATSTAGQSGFDFGFSASYRATFAVAGAGIGAPFGSAAYMYLAGVPLRFITDAATRGVEFYPNFAYAGRIYGSTLQMGASGTTASTVGIPAYFGKNSSTVQVRVGDLSGNCWSLGRDSVTGDFILEPTAPAGTTAFANALKVASATGKVVATYGAQVSTLTSGKPVYATIAGELTTATQGQYLAIATKTADYTLTPTDCVIIGNTASNNVILTLPTAVGYAGLTFHLKSSSALNALTFATTSSQTVDGSTTGSINYPNSLNVISDGANWHAI